MTRWMIRTFVMLSLPALLSACEGDEEATSTDTLDVDDVADATTDVSTDAQDMTGADWATCEYVGDCTLAAASCCGVCGQPTAMDVDAVNRDQLQAHFDAVCEEPAPNCPECAEALNPWLQPTCAAQRCEVLDVAASDLGACVEDSECIVRTPACCECGASTSEYNLIALATASLPDYLPQVCDPRADCAACEPMYPDTLEAFCDVGRCALRTVP